MTTPVDETDFDGDVTPEMVDAGYWASVEHDYERMECPDHPMTYCCPHGDAHNMSLEQAIRHQASVIIRAARPLIVAEERRRARASRR